MRATPLYLIIFIVLACNGPASEQQTTAAQSEQDQSPEEIQQDSLFRTMMAIHDEVMPEMGRMYRLRRRASELADSLQNQPSMPIPADTLKAIASRVEEAEEAMMNWMRSNDFVFEGMSHEEVMQVLETEKEKIIVVREKMLRSIEEAEEALQQFDEN